MSTLDQVWATPLMSTVPLNEQFSFTSVVPSDAYVE